MGGSGPPDIKHGHFLGSWGALGTGPHKGVTTYSLSPNRLRPLAGTAHAAIFNTWRRTRAQVLYWVPPLAVAYMAVDWAIKRNEYLNSKEGRMLEGED